MILRGRIIKGIGGFYYVDAADTLYECKARGLFRNLGITPLVGDECDIEIIDKDAAEAHIVKIHERRTELIRPAVANADQAVVIFAVKNPDLIARGAELFGSQCIVLAVDAKRCGTDRWEIYVNGGRTPTGIDCLEWVKKAVNLGAGEILLTSMDADGTKNGYDIPLTRAVAEAVNVPVIASGGAGTLEHFYDVLALGKADAVLAASVFHYKTFTIRQVKQYLRDKGVEVRL